MSAGVGRHTIGEEDVQFANISRYLWSDCNEILEGFDPCFCLVVARRLGRVVQVPHMDSDSSETVGEGLIVPKPRDLHASAKLSHFGDGADCAITAEPSIGKEVGEDYRDQLWEKFDLGHGGGYGMKDRFVVNS